MKYYKHLFSVLSGIFVAAIIILPLEQAIYKFFPTPPSVDLNNIEEINKHIGELPYRAFIFESICYALGAYVGGMVSTVLINRTQYYPALIVGIALALGGLFNPGPMWFNQFSVAVYIVFSMLGYFTSREKKVKVY